MCYYALSIFLGCGHAIQGRKQVQSLNDCPIVRKEVSLRRPLRTPSLTGSVSTRPSPRTTIGSLESYSKDFEQHDPKSETETPCATKLWHPLFTYRVYGSCKACCTQCEQRLADLESAVVAGTHDTFIAGGKREKVIFEGTEPRDLELVSMNDAAKVAEPEKIAPISPLLLKNNGSTMSYVRGLWNPAKGTPNKPQRPSFIVQESSIDLVSSAGTGKPCRESSHGAKIANPEIEPG